MEFACAAAYTGPMSTDFVELACAAAYTGPMSMILVELTCAAAWSLVVDGAWLQNSVEASSMPSHSQRDCISVMWLVSMVTSLKLLMARSTGA